MAGTNTISPDFRCAAYNTMSLDWEIVDDLKGGTRKIREKAGMYLPRFENEDPKDYDARLKMTFANDHYEQTLEDHVGLIFARMPKLSEDVSDSVAELLENVDGEGTHWQVFLQQVCMKAADYGHAAIYTDYPSYGDGTERPTIGEAQRANLRPYWTCYSAKDIPNWRVTTVGGVKLITRVTLREDHEEEDGYGVRLCDQYRVVTQEVKYDANGVARSLGGLSWELFREVKDANGVASLTRVDGGAIKGPQYIPLRVVYSVKVGVLQSKPHLLQLANTNIQETQVESDYATIMHKCNVPTPIFIGRPKAQQDEPIAMGYGIDIPVGGSATMLEPSGAALGATRTRLEDLRAQMRRQGAFMHEASTTKMTAEEAALYARQRNARIVKLARSLQDGAEGAMEDFVSFLPAETVPSGSITVEMDFGMKFDTAFVGLCLLAYEKGVLPREEALVALATGKLSENFDAEEIAIQMMAEDEKNKQAMATQMQPNDPNADPNATDPNANPIADPATDVIPPERQSEYDA
jgi:hypothetical protein